MKILQWEYDVPTIWGVSNLIGDSILTGVSIHDHRRALNGSLVDANTHTSFYIDNDGVKHIYRLFNLELLQCSYSDVLIKDINTNIWRVKLPSEYNSELIKSTLLKINKMQSNVMPNYKLSNYIRMQKQLEALSVIGNPTNIPLTPVNYLTFVAEYKNIPILDHATNTLTNLELYNNTLSYIDLLKSKVENRIVSLETLSLKLAEVDTIMNEINDVCVYIKGEVIDENSIT